MMSARVLLIDFSRPVAPSMPLSGMTPQEVAHPKCTYIQSDSEDGMGHKALQPSLRLVWTFSRQQRRGLDRCMMKNGNTTVPRP